MMTPGEIYGKWKRYGRREWKVAFLSAFLIGLAVHLPVMVSDIPNHDGLSSMYFDQNMITSGRWFLTVACGFSSYFTLPWLIGLLSLFFLACGAVALTELLELESTWAIVLCSGLWVSFPALTSAFAYIFTLDGYMLGLLLAVLAVLLTKKYRLGFLAGAACLALSLGTYQAYLPFAILLSLYAIVMRFVESGTVKEKITHALHYLYMGVLGGVLYYIVLQSLLKIQGKELDSYQGISGGIGGDTLAGAGLWTTLKGMYGDFLSFTLKDGILCNSFFSAAALLVLAAVTVLVLLRLCARRKWWKSPTFFVIIGVLILALPLATNVILLISPGLNYHLLMRDQWVLYPILMLAFCERYGCGRTGGKFSAAAEWCALCAVFVLVFNYAVTDNIAYSNLQKRYEKTYAYCVRLLDRIEQTEGYYQGIPIAMVGVVGDDSYPLTDITGKVTSGMIGISGDSLLYTGENYQAFIKNYLGATLNFMAPEEMADIYYSEEYIAMDSFPGPNSTKVVDGILYVRTENVGRD